MNKENIIEKVKQKYICKVANRDELFDWDSSK